MKFWTFFLTLNALVALSFGSDITNAVFGKKLDGLPAAFGDFNSDELTDVFVLSEDRRTMQIMFASVEEPLLQPKKGFSCVFKDLITSVVPGDFDGDVFMDVLVTTLNKTSGLTNVYILWGADQKLSCADEAKPVLELSGQPLAMDYNQDMIIDLFGADANNTRTFWVFHSNHSIITSIPMEKPAELDKNEWLEIRQPHANAFLDLNDDFYPDLVITTSHHFEIWYGYETGYKFYEKILTPKSPKMIGQSLHMDVELKGQMDLILPTCSDLICDGQSSIMIYSDGQWQDMNVNFYDSSNNLQWGFALDGGHNYVDTITMRGGDFNMDGYPDLLATLETKNTNALNKKTRSFLLENIPCDSNCGTFNRTFKVRWNALNPFTNESVMAVFYDFYQDGILDVILVLKDETDKTTPYKTAAFKNSLDYDANFVKVMVLTGRTNNDYPISPGSLGKKKRTYGTNLPGPSIAYKTTTQDGSPRSAIAAQLPQSAHFSLSLPYTTFGLGRTPNFIDSLTIGLSNKWREWPQIIPNSQMVVIPNPPTDPSRWKAQLFVTPSKLILLSAAALTATCGLITAIIAALYWKERREDKIEKLQEAHRFHFDAM